MTIGEQSWWIAAIGWVGCAIAFGVAYHRWGKGQQVQRAKFLERLIQKFKDLRYDEFLVKMEQSAKDSQETDSESDDGIGANDFLIFLSYVCYLRNVHIIEDKEFFAFSCYVDRALRNNAICEFVRDFHVKNRMGVSNGPYSELLKYGKNTKMDGVVELCDEIEHIHDAPEQTKTIRLGDIYRTHLDVLNGVFNKGLLFHMSGGSPLNENTIVWFPHVYKDKSSASGRLWYNTLSEDGLELREYCTDAEKRFGGDKERPDVPHRYVFAKFADDKKATGYRFIGIFEFKSREKSSANEICWLYRRVSDTLIVK